MSETYTPEVLWAQRSSIADEEKNYVYLTISVPDVKDDEYKLELSSTTLKFTGTSSSLKKKYQVELEFWAEIDDKKSVIKKTLKNFELKLQKKELKEEFWPRLLKESKKLHFIKTDFDKWVDEDEQNEAAEEDFSQFGGMDGMPGMGGMGGDFGGIDFSKLAGAGGLNPDALGEEDDDEDDEEDEEDIPALEEKKA